MIKFFFALLYEEFKFFRLPLHEGIRNLWNLDTKESIKTDFKSFRCDVGTRRNP